MDKKSRKSNLTPLIILVSLALGLALDKLPVALGIGVALGAGIDYYRKKDQPS